MAIGTSEYSEDNDSTRYMAEECILRHAIQVDDRYTAIALINAASYVAHVNATPGNGWSKRRLHAVRAV